MKTNEHVDEADARLEEAALVLEGMAHELRCLKKKNSKAKMPVDDCNDPREFEQADDNLRISVCGESKENAKGYTTIQHVG
jgi:hypothetical protein